MMFIVGAFLRGNSRVVLAYSQEVLRDELRCILQGLPSPFGAPPAREDFITERLHVIASFAVLGKVLQRPVLPGLLLSRAHFIHYCVDTYHRRVDITMSCLVACIYACLMISVDVADFMRSRLP